MSNRSFHAYNDEGEFVSYTVVRDGDRIQIPEMGESFVAPLDEDQRAQALSVLEFTRDDSEKECYAVARNHDAANAALRLYKDEIDEINTAKRKAAQRDLKHELVFDFVKKLRAAVHTDRDRDVFFTPNDATGAWDRVLEAAKKAILVPKEGDDQ